MSGWTCEKCGGTFDHTVGNIPRCRGTWLPRDVPVAVALVDGRRLDASERAMSRACDWLLARVRPRARWPEVFVGIVGACALWCVLQPLKIYWWARERARR